MKEGEDKLLALQAVKEEKIWCQMIGQYLPSPALQIIFFWQNDNKIVLVIISVVKNQQEGLLKFQNPQPKGKIEIDILHFLSSTVSPTLDFADFATYCL